LTPLPLLAAATLDLGDVDLAIFALYAASKVGLGWCFSRAATNVDLRVRFKTD
jgi:hypothetical protein